MVGLPADISLPIRMVLAGFETRGLDSPTGTDVKQHHAISCRDSRQHR